MSADPTSFIYSLPYSKISGDIVMHPVLVNFRHWPLVPFVLSNVSI